MKRKRELTENELFIQVALNGAVPDKDGFIDALTKLGQLYNKTAVHRECRQRHQRGLFTQFETSSASEQVKLIDRLKNLVKLID